MKISLTYSKVDLLKSQELLNPQIFIGETVKKNSVTGE